jgi:hypothetical protein
VHLASLIEYRLHCFNQHFWLLSFIVSGTARPAAMRRWLSASHTLAIARNEGGSIRGIDRYLCSMRAGDVMITRRPSHAVDAIQRARGGGSQTVPFTLRLQANFDQSSQSQRRPFAAGRETEEILKQAQHTIP